MRHPGPLGIVFLGLPIVAGCSATTPPRPPPTNVAVAVNAAPGQDSSEALPGPPSGGRTAGDSTTPLHARRLDRIPKVLRRIANEHGELVEQLRAMAADLQDASGRARALGETRELAIELSQISASLGSGDDAPSEVLDDAASGLMLLETRIGLLHRALRAATNRTTAVMID